MEENFKLDIMQRPRRLRRNPAMLAMCEETLVRPCDLIQPLFVTHENESAPIESMPNQMRLTMDDLLRKCENLMTLGIQAVALFPHVKDSLKTPDAGEALNPKSTQNKAISALKEALPELQIVADIALDPYTPHGHDGFLNSRGNWILNDETVEMLVRMSVVAARAGADIIAPSDMMDGRIGAIRKGLDDAGFSDVAIMSYSAKYASALYGPFRGAIGSAQAKPIDKTGYQLNPANCQEALREAHLDEFEGADILMVKPAGFYLDIISKIRKRTNLPVAAYQVSGEYAMICAAAQNGWIDLQKARDESLISIKRAGANIILTYFAESFARAF